MLEFAVITVTVGVMQRYVMTPMVRGVESKRQEVMILIEIIRRLVPERTVTHRVTLCLIVSVGILDESPAGIGLQIFIELVEFPQPSVVQVLIGRDACLDTVGAIHQAQVIAARNDTVPCLSCLLEVADVLVADAEVVVQPGQSAIVRARPTGGAVYIAVGSGFMVGSVENKVIRQQACGELHTGIIGVV